MSTDVREDTAAPVGVPVPPSRHRRRAWFLLAFAAWNVWVWITRAVNLINEDATYSAAFIAVHLVLYTVGIGGAIVLTVMGIRMLREARAERA